MADIAGIKSYFETSDTPTQSEFTELIEGLSSSYGLNLLSEANDLSHGVIGEWVKAKTGDAAPTVNSDSVDFITTANQYSGVKITSIERLKAGVRYFVKLKIQVTSGTEYPLRIGYPTTTGEYFQVTPTTSEVEYSGAFTPQTAQLYICVGDSSSSGTTYRVKDIELIEEQNKFPYIGQNELSKGDALSNGTFGNWVISKSGTTILVNTDSLDCTTTTTQYSGIRLDNKFELGKRYRVRLKIQVTSGTEYPLRIGYPAGEEDEYFEITPTTSEVEYSGYINPVTISQLYVCVKDSSSSGMTFRVKDVELILSEYEHQNFRNLDNLNKWYASIRSNIYNSSGQTKVMMIGDSWTMRSGGETGGRGYTGELAQLLFTEFGKGSIGWCGSGSNSKNQLDTNLGSWSRSGTFTDYNKASGSKSPDLTEAEATTTGGLYTIVAPAANSYNAGATDVQIFYYNQVGGGSFRWRINAGSWTTVSTDAAETVATVDISGLDDSVSNTLELEITVASGGIPVKILGFRFFNTDIQGVHVDSIGRGGAASVDFATTIDDTAHQWVLNKIDPDLVLITLGTNDLIVQDTNSHEFKTNMETLIDRIKTALPDASILLYSSADNYWATANSSIYKMVDYDRKCEELAIENGIAYISGYDLFGLFKPVAGWSSGARDRLGMYEDVSAAAHLSAEGDYLMAKNIFDKIK